MAKLYDAETATFLGTIADSQLRFLINQLEEESATDQDYYLDRPTIDLLEQNGADASVVTMLRQALGSRDGMEIRWVSSKRTWRPPADVDNADRWS